MTVSLDAAKQASRETTSDSKAGYYAGTLKTPPRPEGHSGSARPTSEPADPKRVDHEERRGARLAHPSFDAERLPAPLVECGCGGCEERVDPLADEVDGPFGDVLDRGNYMAVEECESPRPMTVERASEAYLRYQRAAWNREDWTSLYERTQSRHGLLMGAERDVLQRYDGDESVLFLSLRLSPVETVEGERRWVSPVQLDQRLHDSWQNVYATMQYQLREFEWEYVAVTTTTTTAATPHTHVQVLVEDPDDGVTVGMAESIVESHVKNTKGARPEDHPVERGERDAGIVFHDPPRVDPDDERDLRLLRARDGEGFPLNTVTMQYVADQRPHWALGNVYDGASEVHRDSVLLDGAAIAWASSHHWLRSSDGFDLGSGR